MSKVAPPHISRLKRLGRRCATALRGGEQVVRADARGHQRLVRVAKRGVGDQQALLLCAPRRRISSGPSFCRSWREPGGGSIPGVDGSTAASRRFGYFLAFHFGIAVEDHVAEVREQLGGAIAAAGKAKQFGRIVEKRGGDFAGAKFRVIDDVFDERNVGLDAADAELAEGAVHALDRLRAGARPRR